MPTPFVDPCEACQQEIAELQRTGQWSQRLYQLQTWMWQNGCPGHEPPQTVGWAVSHEPPIRAGAPPGNPDDREPPTW